MIYRSNFFVITGGPGAGKTTLIDALSKSGCQIVEEAGRRIIRDQKARGGNATHDGDRLAYRDLMFEDAVRTFAHLSNETGPVFFDRGLPDLIGYSRLIGAPVPAELRDAAAHYRYNRTVFIAPPWEEIYAQDSDRKQDFAEAIATYEAMRAAYEGPRYSVICLPKTSVGARVDFVLGRVQSGATMRSK